MKDLVIYGASGFGREMLQITYDINREKPVWNALGFLDDDSGLVGNNIAGFPVLGNGQWLIDNPGVFVIVAIGSTPVRRRIVRRLETMGHSNFATLIHPMAWVGDRVNIGPGCAIFAGALASVDIQIGSHVIVNKNATLGHDVVLGDFVTVAPNASISGAVTVGEGADVGANATVIQQLSIGEWTIVGAGAVVSRSLPPNVTAVGVPARAIKERPVGWQD